MLIHQSKFAGKTKENETRKKGGKGHRESEESSTCLDTQTTWLWSVVPKRRLTGRRRGKVWISKGTSNHLGKAGELGAGYLRTSLRDL